MKTQITKVYLEVETSRDWKLRKELQVLSIPTLKCSGIHPYTMYAEAHTQICTQKAGSYAQRYF